MTRELDWKIHELMGNDLTGWEWESLSGNLAQKRVISTKWELMTIPHYSTTWEGAGLVTEWLRKDETVRTRIYDNYEGCSVRIEKYTRKWDSPWEVVGHCLETEFPLALAKAFISAMEERDNDKFKHI